MKIKDTYPETRFEGFRGSKSSKRFTSAASHPSRFAALLHICEWGRKWREWREGRGERGGGERVKDR